jgi:predicted ATPase/DNA-binding CsgD family transcriptional regulator
MVRSDYGVCVDAVNSAFPFVGREEELEKLRTLMPRAEGEGRRVALLSGEPGAGKSRLAREFAAEAVADGALVLYGACDPELRSPYSPFIEALDRLARTVEPDELREALGAAGGELTRLLPDLPALAGDLPAPVEADPDTERHRLHNAVAGLLENVSRRRPVLLVLEDGHWADAPTLTLLRHLARSAGAARLLLLATFRDTEADVPRALAETLAELRRSEDVVRMRLGGLSGSEVADLVRRAADSDPEAELGELATAIHDLTDGNPFLVCELWRALAETEVVEVAGGAVRVTRPVAELGTPESVREVAGQRIARLGEGTVDLLEAAAVAGPEFELEQVRRAAGLGEEELLAAFDEAVASGMVEELPSQRLGCRFTHELVRRALYDGLARGRRAELHLRVGEALERTGARSARDLTDLARHFGAAAPLGGGERAVDYNLRAAAAAGAALAFDEAATRLRTALEVGIPDDAERAATLLELGVALRSAGHWIDSLRAFGEAAELARGLGRPELLAQAAIGYEETCWRPGLARREAVELLEEALTALDEDREGDEGLRIDLLAGLGRAMSLAGDLERGELVFENAVALARPRVDRAALAKVLVRAYWARGARSMEETLSMITEARDLAAEVGDTETRTEAMAWRVCAFTSLFELDLARAETEAMRETAESTAQPFKRHVAEHCGSAIALCQGSFAEAEEMALRSHEWAQLLTGRDASGLYGVQMFSLRREQGRLAELAPAVRILAGDKVRSGPWRPGLVAVLAELGMDEEARRELTALAAEGIDGLRETLWLASLVYLTDASSAVGHEETAALVFPELERFAGANTSVGHLVACYGAADRYLGMLAATLGETGRAEAYFERALERNREMGASTWVAHTAYEYGRLLRGRGGAARARADALLGEAATLAERIGMAGLLAKVRALGFAPTGAGLPDDLSPREAQLLALVARGLSNREVGEELTISEHTAANHMRSILRKTGCANRTEAASYAHRHGLA